MSNRHLYKAKRIDNGEWIKGHIAISYSLAYIIQALSDGNFKWYDVDPSTICQCTGLEDKNDKLIWENDVVAFTDMFSTENGYSEADCVGKVIWGDEEVCFNVTERLSAESWEVLQECWVIGNIFDNPELLERGAD